MCTIQDVSDREVRYVEMLELPALDLKNFLLEYFNPMRVVRCRTINGQASEISNSRVATFTLEH